jgi:hypothetical protein
VVEYDLMNGPEYLEWWKLLSIGTEEYSSGEVVVVQGQVVMTVVDDMEGLGPGTRFWDPH